MKCLILAAGYATRLYPLTENFPKPLLQIRGKTILDWLIDDIDSLGWVEEYVVISNHKYVDFFNAWKQGKKQVITVVDDGTVSNETRLGAVRDIQFAIEKCGLDDDMLVIAGDNLLDFSLTVFMKYAKEKQSPCIMRYFENSVQRLRKSGVAEVDENDKVICLSEKPFQPKSHWACPPFYYYTKAAAKLISEGIDAGCGVDAPGSYIAWLCQKMEVYAMEMPGQRYDIGDLADYNNTSKAYKGIKNV